MIETPRLLLRRWRDSDAGAFAAMNADAEVMADLAGARQPMSEAGLEEWNKIMNLDRFDLVARAAR
jgi:RimJ/RimL family protein N-acetyltransferase